MTNIQKTNQEIIIYNTDDGKASVSLMTKDGNVWLNQNQLAELFDTSKQNVSLHIINILKENELDANSVVKDYLTTAADGKNYNRKQLNNPRRVRNSYLAVINLHYKGTNNFSNCKGAIQIVAIQPMSPLIHYVNSVDMTGYKILEEGGERKGGEAALPFSPFIINRLGVMSSVA